MLKELAITDFKSFRNETIRFGPKGLTVLVGPNGSGKSSVLEAAFYSVFSHFPALPAMPGAPLVREGAKRFQLRLSVDASHVVAGASLVEVVQFLEDDHRTITRLIERRGEPTICVRDDTTPNVAVPLPPELSAVVSTVPFPRSFDVDLRALRWPLRPGPRDAAVFGAEQVVQALFDLKMGSDATSFSRLIAQLKKVVPGVQGLAMEGQPLGAKDEYRFTFDMSSGANLDSSQVSEGTLLTLSILAAAELVKRPTLLLIDDIDRALHPTAQRELVKLLRQVVALGHLEIICTTHSPYILSEFALDEVLVLKEVDGESRCMSLADGPDAQRWMKELDAGEYWSFVEQKLFQKSA